MGRWEPGAGDRLRSAALELFAERGYDQTTVADIADRAGVTARTFFRHYSDKREVLFVGSEMLRDAMVSAVERAPATTAALDAVGAGLARAAEFLGGHHDLSSGRQRIIDSHSELRERELIKMAGLGSDLAGALRRRGVPPTDASLAAEAGIAVLRVSFERWVAGDASGPGLDELMRDSMAQLRSLVVVD